MNGSRSSDDIVFQAAGPDVENARGPNVDVSVLGITSWLSSADRSRVSDVIGLINLYSVNIVLTGENKKCTVYNHFTAQQHV